MLAAHLRRLERPVRYAAMDPAHVRAIENYLRIVTRAFGLPQSHRQQAQDDTPSSLGTLYKKHPHIEPHFQGILQGDHVALAQYLDLLQDLGDIHLPQQEYASHHLGNPNFLDHLARMHSNADDPQSGIHTMYSQAALEHPSTRGVLNPAYGTSMTPGVPPMFLMAGQLQHELELNGLQNHPLAQQLLQHRTTMNSMEGSWPHAIAGMHDVSHGLQQEPQMRHIRKTLLEPLESRASSVLGHLLIPHLAENFG